MLYPFHLKGLLCLTELQSNYFVLSIWTTFRKILELFSIAIKNGRESCRWRKARRRNGWQFWNDKEKLKKKRKNFLRLFTQTRPFKPKLGFTSLRCSVVLFSTFVLQLKKGVHKGRKNKKVFLNRKK